MRLHSLKETRFWINREEKTELEKTQDLKHMRKENIRGNNFREYSYLNLRKKKNQQEDWNLSPVKRGRVGVAQPGEK